jgi:ATP-dependent Lon protease
MTLLKSNAELYGFTDVGIDKYDVHIHTVPPTCPKPGSSFGMAMLAALVSQYTGRSMKPMTIMTGEISLMDNLHAVSLLSTPIHFRLERSKKKLSLHVMQDLFVSFY